MLITALFLFGCEKTYTVSDFENNKELLDEYNKKCQNGELDRESPFTICASISVIKYCQ